jgi:hypothetical protein
LVGSEGGMVGADGSPGIEYNSSLSTANQTKIKKNKNKI